MAFASLGTAATIGLIAAGTGAADTGGAQEQPLQPATPDDWASHAPTNQMSEEDSILYGPTDRPNEPIQAGTGSVGAVNGVPQLDSNTFQALARAAADPQLAAIVGPLYRMLLQELR